VTALDTARRAAAESAPAGCDRATSDYAALMSAVQRAHLLDRSASAYVPRMLLLAAMTTGGALTFLWLGRSWWQIALAAHFGVVFAQLGFLGHDAGHQQIFRSRRWNDRVGLLLSNLGVGLSYGWWVDKHNRHHRHPNAVGRDPDVARNVLAWTEQQANQQRGLLRVVARHQAAFFFPLLLLEALNLHVGSVRTLLRKPREHVVELALLSAHVAGGLALALLVLRPLQAFVFVVAQQSVFGLYLGCSFAPNHKGMPMLDDATSSDFFRRQVLTARNITGGRLLTAVFGGLNYQIEHHLFPSMPSRNLRRCRPIVKEFCAARGVDYCEKHLFGSYAQALRYLRSVRPRGADWAMPDAAPGAVPFEEADMAGKNKGGREARKPKQEQNKKQKGQQPTPANRAVDAINLPTGSRKK
jgi:fatty acid desaturase